jgi:hypothetical protein
MCGNGVSRVIILVLLRGRPQRPNALLIIFCGGHHGVQAMLECFLDDAAELNQSLVGFSKEIPIFKRAHIEPCAKEQANGCVDQLLVGVQIFTK